MLLSSVLLLSLASGFHSSYCDTHHVADTSGIRAIDFCNFEYPAIKFPNDQKRTPPHFKLERGVLPPDGDDPSKGGLITLEEIKYADVTGDGREEALIVLTWHSGGTMQLSMVYVWSIQGTAPVLLWSFGTGDRAYGGLHDFYAQNGRLVVELHDPESAEGNCCARRIVRTTYRWDGTQFVQLGNPDVLPNPEYKNQER